MLSIFCRSGDFTLEIILVAAGTLFHKNEATFPMGIAEAANIVTSLSVGDSR